MSKSQKGGNSPRFLNHKTNRENNKNPFEFISSEIRCSICLEFQLFSKECYKCISCQSYFHLDCYNYFNLNESDEEDLKLTQNNVNTFVCIKCKEKKSNSPIFCSICKEDDGILKKLNNDYYHHYCYVFFKDNIKNKTKPGSCKVCKKRTLPSIVCTEKNCKERYHIKCALENGIIYSLPYYTGDEKIEEESFNDYVPFKCPEHNKLFFDNYRSFITAMTQSINDKNKSSITNNNTSIINENQNQNANSREIIYLNNEKDNNNLTNVEEETQKIDNKSISSNVLSDENYEGSNNDREEADEASDKTPPNNFVIKKENNPDNNKSTENININHSNNKDVINITLAKNINNIQLSDNKNNNKNVNSNNINKSNVNIKMEIEDAKKSERSIKENKEKTNNKGIIEEGEKSINDIIKNINLGKKNQMNEKEKEKEIKTEIKTEKEEEKEIKKEKEEEKEEYKIPEIKFENIDLFENFRKMNDNYCFPSYFYRMHGI